MSQGENTKEDVRIPITGQTKQEAAFVRVVFAVSRKNVVNNRTYLSDHYL